MDESNYIVILKAESEEHLLSLKNKAIDSKIEVSEFREPDLNDEITAVAFMPCEESKILLKKLPLV